VRKLLDRWGDLALACGFFIWTQLDVWHASATELRVAGGRGVLTCLLLVIAASLAVRRRAPAAALILASASLIVAALVVRHSQGVPVEVFLALLVLFYSVGAHCEERRSPVVGGIALAAIAAVDLAKPGFFNGSSSPRPGAWLAFAIAWLVGRDLRRRRQHVEGLKERAERLEREREEKALLAAAEERTRIARELHDVVAHRVSMMVVQAEAGPVVVEREPATAAQAFDSIGAIGRQALAEMRRLLGVLRSDDDRSGPSLGPQPGLDQLPALVEQAREAGLEARLEVQGEPRPLPPGMDLSAYRIVQEALTNAVRHAGPSTARVLIRYGDADLRLEVRDDGLGPRAGNGAGHGLIGMRERVNLFGGELDAGPRPDGGFAVAARLPLPSS